MSKSLITQLCQSLLSLPLSRSVLRAKNVRKWSHGNECFLFIGDSNIYFSFLLGWVSIAVKTVEILWNTIKIDSFKKSQRQSKFFTRKYIVMVWTGIEMDIPKQYTTTALMCRKRTTITSPIGVGKNLGAHFLGILAIARLYIFTDSQTNGVRSKDHVEIRLRTSETKVNDNNSSWKGQGRHQAEIVWDKRE